MKKRIDVIRSIRGSDGQLRLICVSGDSVLIKFAHYYYKNDRISYGDVGFDINRAPAYTSFTKAHVLALKNRMNPVKLTSLNGWDLTRVTRHSAYVGCTRVTRQDIDNLLRVL